MKTEIRCELIINKAMRSAMEHDNPDEQIQEFIRFLGNHIGSDRIYIFEDDLVGRVTNNTYEWCKDGIDPQINVLQQVDMDIIEWWYDTFDRDENVIIRNVEDIKEQYPMTYETLAPQKIECVAVSALRYHGQISGFFGVDNPRDTDMEELSLFLDMIGTFLVSLLKLRNSFDKSNQEASLNSYSALAQIYLSMHLVNVQSGRFQMIKTTPHIEQQISAEGGDDFAVQIRNVMEVLANEKYAQSVRKFTDISTLEDRMCGKCTIAHEYLGNVSGWCRERFIKVDEDEDGHLLHVLYAVEVIDEEKRRENRLLYLSEMDLMTGIRNRGSGERKIKETIAQNIPGMFVILDCDKFKSINDTYGHAVGDEVIIAVAKTLQGICGEKDTLLRLGGDEFAMYIPGMLDDVHGQQLADEVIGRMQDIRIPELGGRVIHVSMGAAFHRKDDLDFERLYRQADSAMYQSKKIVGSSIVFYK
ncbi:GGDEF domain-containing protein [Jutongia sp.]